MVLDELVKGFRFFVKIHQPANRELLETTAEFINYGIQKKDDLFIKLTEQIK